MPVIKKIMLSLSLVMSLSALGTDDFMRMNIYIAFAGASFFLGLPDKQESN